MLEFKINSEVKKTFPRKLVVIFLCFSVAIILVGISFYKSQRKRIFSEYQNDLSAIASLKIGQIQQWQRERLGDAAVIMANEPLISFIKQYFRNKNKPELTEELTKLMKSLCTEYDYRSVLFVDTSLKVRLNLLSADSVAGEIIGKNLSDVMENHRIILTDLHWSESVGYAHLDLLVPLVDPESKNESLAGILILRIDPSKLLFPLIQSWPTPSKSSETLIVRKDGDSILYLNELRHVHNTSLKLKAPLSNINLLGSKAVNGFKGVTEGMDYRNVAVVGYLDDIPGFPWFMISKVDKDEILLPLKKYLILIIIVIVLLLLINASIFGFWIWQQRIKFSRRQLMNEDSIHELEERFTTAFMMSPVSVSISSLSDNKFIDVNNTFLEDLEYKREEVIGRTAKELDLWADETDRIWLINEIAEKGKVFGKVIGFKSKTGELIFGLTSISVIHVNGEPCNLSTVVNITANKKAEMKLIESEELFRKLFENMLNGFAYCKMIIEEGQPLDFLYINVNEAFAALTGLKDVIGKRASEAIPGIQESDPELLERYNRVSSSGVPDVFETYVESLHMWFAISVYSTQKGYFVAVFDVITSRKLAEEKLQETNEYLSNLFNYANAPIIVWDPSLIITQFNPAFEQLSGYMKQDVLGRKIDLLFQDEKKAASVELIKNAISGERWESIEIEIQRKTLDSRIVLWNSANIHAKDGKTVVSTIAQGQDITKRKIAQEELRESELIFRQTFDLSPIGIVMVGLDKKFLRCNDAFSNSLGYRMEELVGRSIAEVTYSADIEIGMAEMMKIAIGDLESSHVQKRYLRIDGQIVWGDVLISLIRNNSGEPQYFLAIIQDITESKKSVEALRESEDKFKYVFDHSVIGKSITFPSGEIHVNEAFCDMLGYSQTELESIKWQNITHSDDIERTEKELQTLLSGEKDSMRIIKRYIHKDGSVIWTDLSTSLRREAAGNPLYFMTSVIDITELKNAEEILRNDEKRFRELIEALPQLYWTCRIDGPCDYLSNQWVEYTGIRESDQLGYKWLQQLHPEDRETTIKEWSEKVKIGSSFDIEFRIRRYDGEFHWFKTRAVPIHDSEGRLIRWLGSNTDIDSIRRAEDQLRNYNKDLEQRVLLRTEQLESANKELEAFSYSVSHDLRAPLRSVHGFTKILLEDYEANLDEEGKRICGIISSSATQMGELIDDLLSFSRIGRSSLNPSLIDMKKMARVVFEGMTSPAERERIQLDIGNLQKAFGDVTLFGQVWTNLISNAIKYTSKNSISEINIGSKVDGGMITYFIKDNGVGFDIQYAHKLFGVFQRLHSEADFEGNGVGLAIIQRIILKHGGKVWAEGEVGKGATFYFSLPLNGDRQLASDDRQKKILSPDA